MNWQVGLRRVEIVYWLVGALAVCAVCLAAGGNSYASGWQRLIEPTEVWWWTTSAYDHGERTFPAGMTADQVRVELVRSGLLESSNPTVPFVGIDYTFRWWAVGPAFLVTAGIAVGVWIVAKIALWIGRGFTKA